VIEDALTDAAQHATGPPSLPIAGQPPERCDAIRNRGRILAAAREIVAEHGAEGLSMNALAAAAGVGKGTIFRRFGDRDGLLYALLDEDTIALQDGFLSGPPPLGPGAPARERLEAFVIAYVRFQLAHLELLLAAQQGHVEAASHVMAAFRVHVATLVSEIDPTLDAGVVAALIINTVSAPLIRRLQIDVGTSPEALERAALALLRGLTGGC
jgi:AcrR family transcriptional regulator